MNKFKSAGYRLALDDIGVGSSNFKSLFDFPVDYFKIDRSYCESMRDNEAVRAFIQIIINEANKTNKKTIAEGIFWEASHFPCKDFLWELLSHNFRHPEIFYIPIRSISVDMPVLSLETP